MKKRMLSILLTAMIAIGILSTTAYATEVQQNYSIKVPLNAKVETVNGTLIYSDFTDTEGNYYDYYNPKDGSYFRWKGVPTDSGSVSPQVVSQKVRDFEFMFGSDGLDGRANGKTFKIGYDSGYYFVDSYLYDSRTGRKVETDKNYTFEVKLLQELWFGSKTIATLEAATEKMSSKAFDCTADKNYYFTMKLIDKLPKDPDHNYFIKGSGQMYGWPSE